MSTPSEPSIPPNNIDQVIAWLRMYVQKIEKEITEIKARLDAGGL